MIKKNHKIYNWLFAENERPKLAPKNVGDVTITNL